MPAAQPQPMAALAEHLGRAHAPHQGVAQTLVKRAHKAMAEGLSWPSSREEAWRYTPIAHLTTPTWHRASLDGPSVLSDAPFAVQAIAGPKLVFVDGALCDAWSDAAALMGPGVWVGTLAEALKSEAPWLAAVLGQHAKTESQGLTALNQASLRDGAAVHIAAKARLPEGLHIVYVQSGHQSHATLVQPRTIIALEHHAEATVWEHYIGTSTHVTWTNAVTEVHLAPHAQLNHVTMQAESTQAVHTSQLAASVGEHARLSAFALSQGAQSARREMHVRLDGEGAETNLAGLYLADASAHHDFQVNLHHNKPHTQSTQNFRGILQGHTTGVFSGTVYVAPGAAKTNAKQLCRSLLLSAQARAHAQPRLEILTDDVKCAHGATVGELDDDALFYLQSRGLDAAQAQRLLTYAFAAEALADAPKQTYRALAQAVRTQMGLTDLGDSAC